jgi:hypothetical protein
MGGVQAPSENASKTLGGVLLANGHYAKLGIMSVC